MRNIKLRPKIVKPKIVCIPWPPYAILEVFLLEVEYGSFLMANIFYYWTSSRPIGVLLSDRTLRSVMTV